MGKIKKRSKKREIIDKIASKASKVSTNPFEIRFHKEKHAVLGRASKRDVGKPGISRSKALEKRKKSLLVEYKRKDKNNVFNDKRIGEGNVGLTPEEKMMARFTAERLRSHDKKNIFNLADDETLTHFGKSLGEIEQFEDPRSDDEDDEKNDKKLDANYVNKLHFGGFMDQSEIEFSKGHSNSRKEWIETMISDSKTRKLEKQKNQEEALNLTAQLDANWKEMVSQPFLIPSALQKVKGQEDKEKDNGEGEKEEESYDVMLRMLGMEPKKAKATDRLKTKEEIIQEEKENLEKLEQERQNRMKCDGFENEEEEEEEINEDDDDDEDDDEINVDEKNEKEKSENESDDNYSDLEDESDEESSKEIPELKKYSSVPFVKKSKSKVSTESIPFTFLVPDSYEELLVHFEDHSSPSDIALIISRIIKCNHPQFGLNNKNKLETFFTILLQYIHDTLSRDTFYILQTKAILPFLYDIAHFSPYFCAKAILDVICEKYENFVKKSKVYPGLDTIVYFQIAMRIFPSSDYRHPVITPVYQFMTHILSTAKVNSRFAISSGLLISSIFIESLSISKRFCPELLNFLEGILYLGLSQKDSDFDAIPPFKSVGKDSEILFHPSDFSPVSLNWSSVSLELDEIDGLFSVTAIHTALECLTHLLEFWSHHSSVSEIFQNVFKFSKLLLEKKTFSSLQNKLESIISKINSLSKVKRPIVSQIKKPPLLKLYDPEIIEDFDPFNKGRRSGSKNKLELDKLTHKFKREKKGAKKEIRADSAFLANQKAKEAREKDEERKRKTKEIMAGLGNQEGDFRKMLKDKNKRFKK